MDKKNILTHAKKLDLTDKLDLCCKLLGVGVSVDNYGQITLYTNLMYDTRDNKTVVEFCEENFDGDW